MYKRTRKTIVLFAMLVCSIAVMAVPAKKTPYTIVQPNGKTITLLGYGDERVHWATTLDGYTVMHRSDGNFVYAVKNSNGDLVASNVAAANAEERTSKESTFLRTISPNLTYSASQIKKMKADFAPINRNNSIKANGDFPTTGSPKLLVILVAFNDLSFTYSQANFNNMCNQTNYNNTGSIKDYFLASSGNALNLDIDVVGPYTLSNNMATYGNNGNTGYYNFVKDAVNAANADVDFSQYDNNNDGYVDDICLIFAGTPESTTRNPDEIWPHSGYAHWYGNTITKDGVMIDKYSCSAEKRSSYQMDNIGTFCHEFSHVLGLPDEYDTDYEANGSADETVGKWSLMCQGSYNNDGATPCLWSAAQKVRTGWLTDLDTLNVSQDSLALPLNKGGNHKAYRINFPNSDEFLFFEYRKQQGFDAYVPGQGLLIYHGRMGAINAWINNHDNTININPQYRGWFIEPANGGVAVDNTSAPFPGYTNVTYFTKDSPNPATYVIGGNSMDVAITDIHYVDDSTMMFNFNSSLPEIKTNAYNYASLGMHNFSATGKVLYNGKHSMSAKGIVYSLNANCPYDAQYAVVDSTISDTINISATITGLQRGTQYYYRAYFIASDGTVGLGNVMSVTTVSGFGNTTAMSATNITDSTATLKGSLNTRGLAAFVEKGIIYSTDTNSLNLESSSNNIYRSSDSTLGTFSVDIENLTGATRYYYVAYVTNAYGTYYSNRLSFTTTYPAVTNNTISSSQAFCLGTTPNELTGPTPEGGYGNFTYLWQEKHLDGGWQDASGVNDNQNYQPSNITDSTYFRRQVVSDGRITTFSNTVLLDARISRGGYIYTSSDTYNQNESANLVLTDYRGSVVAWEKNSGNSWENIGEENNPNITEVLSNNGTISYRVKVQIDNCPSAYSEVKSITVIGSSIENVDENMQFSVVPNPSPNGVFTINSTMNNAQSIVIANTIGQIVYNEKNVDLRDKTIKLNNIENGTYVISILNDGKLISRKIIINK